MPFKSNLSSLLKVLSYWNLNFESQEVVEGMTKLKVLSDWNLNFETDEVIGGMTKLKVLVYWV